MGNFQKISAKRLDFFLERNLLAQKIQCYLLLMRFSTITQRLFQYLDFLDFLDR